MPVCHQDLSMARLLNKEKLGMVEKAEQLLLDYGFHQLRVRIHGKLARIEVMPEEFEKLLAVREEVTPNSKAMDLPM